MLNGSMSTTSSSLRSWTQKHGLLFSPTTSQHHFDLFHQPAARVMIVFDGASNGEIVCVCEREREMLQLHTRSLKIFTLSLPHTHTHTLPHTHAQKTTVNFWVVPLLVVLPSLLVFISFLSPLSLCFFCCLVVKFFLFVCLFLITGSDDITSLPKRSVLV